MRVFGRDEGGKAYHANQNSPAGRTIAPNMGMYSRLDESMSDMLLLSDEVRRLRFRWSLISSIALYGVDI